MYKPIDADVIIIGGGLAGLSAAFFLNLKEPTLQFNVLEGGNDIGGRAFSVPLVVENEGNYLSYFDIGGQWVCQEQNHLLNLLDALDITTVSEERYGKIIVGYKDIYTVDSANDIFRFFGAFDKLQFTKFIDEVEIICNKINEGDVDCITELSQITLYNFIENIVNSKAVQAVLDYIVWFNCGTTTWEISALFYMAFCISTKGIANQLPTETVNLHELQIKGGAKNICDKIAEEIGRRYIFTDQHVTDVICNHGYVEIKTRNKSYYCYDVIIAVSPNDILNINFSPPLPPNKINPILNTCTNVVTHFTVTYPREFWRDSGFSGVIYIFDKSYTHGPIDFCANVSIADKAALVGRIFNGKVTQNNHPLYKTGVLEQLSAYFGTEALTPIDYFEKCCRLETSQMICWNVDNRDYIQNVSESMGRLFWAGAETSPEWYGCLAGAIYSGNRAALEVLYDLRPSLLTINDMAILSPTRRNTLGRLKECPKSNIYYSVIHWKYYISVSVIILFVLWRSKKKYFK